MIQNNLNKAQCGLRECLIFTINQPKAAEHRFWSEANGDEFSFPNLFDQTGGGQERNSEAGHDEALDHFGGVELHGDLGVVFDVFHPLIEAAAGGAGFREEEGVIDEVFGGDRRGEGEGMAGRDDEFELVGMNEDDLEFFLLDGELADAEVGEVIDDGFDDSGAVGAVDVDLDVGEKLFEFAEDVGKDVEAGGFVGGDDEFAAGHFIEFVDIVLRAAAEVENLFAVVGEDFSGGGEGDAGAEAIEEGGVEFLFELAHLSADGWLRAEAREGGLGEALQANNLQKRV